MGSKRDDYTTVSIPKPLAEKAKKHIEGTGFNSLSDYVSYILREIVSSKKAWERGDENIVKEKLRRLGYL